MGFENKITILLPFPHDLAQCEWTALSGEPHFRDRPLLSDRMWVEDSPLSQNASYTNLHVHNDLRLPSSLYPPLSQGKWRLQLFMPLVIVQLLRMEVWTNWKRECRLKVRRVTDSYYCATSSFVFHVPTNSCTVQLSSGAPIQITVLICCPRSAWAFLKVHTVLLDSIACKAHGSFDRTIRCRLLQDWNSMLSALCRLNISRDIEVLQ